jgi:hypothetical protein
MRQKSNVQGTRMQRGTSIAAKTPAGVTNSKRRTKPVLAAHGGPPPLD